MSDSIFLPEGALIHTEQNLKNLSSISALHYTMEHEIIVEGEAAICDAEHNLTVNLNGYTGIIPHADTAIGIEEGITREIAVISRVGKPVACTIRGIEEENGKINLYLSRTAAQKRALRHLMTRVSPGDVIPARVTHLEPFGAFVDVGCGNISLIGIEAISVSRISHPNNRFRVGDEIFTVVSGLDFDKSRIFLSHRELLGTWEENAARFDAGQTVRGIVRGIEDYGIFIELSPNLSGLAEFRPDVKLGDAVSVFIKSILPEKMKIKLIIIDVFREKFERFIVPADYFVTSGHIDVWRYSPEKCTRKEIISVFR
ncbi:MAG: S1 RNA-binding domain-containing protein [Oscillospiraceae bacterium]|nr:S1 RNA-binding domain-containing protein [Oscillospiraceae bacterium]